MGKPTQFTVIMLVTLFVGAGVSFTLFATESTLGVRIPASHATLLDALGLQPDLRIDYGGFVWLQLDQDRLRLLTAAGVPTQVEPEAWQVRLPGFRFDPLRDGEPVLPAFLKADQAGPRLQLVQLVGPPRQQWLQALEDAGTRVLQYLPHHTYLVWREEQCSKGLPGFVRWHGEYHPAYKISPHLEQKAGMVRFVNIRTTGGERLTGTLAEIEACGAQIHQHFPACPDKSQHDVIVAVKAARIADLAGLRQVIWLGFHDPDIRLGDEMADAIVAGEYEEDTPQPGYLEWLDEVGYDGDGVIWSVVDSGVDPDHPDFRLVGGYSHGCDTPSPGDDEEIPVGHGTAVASLVAGTAATGITDADGFLYGLGVAPGARLHSQNSCFETNPASIPPGGWQVFGSLAVAAGCSGSNNSWGGLSGRGYNAVSQTYDYLVRDADFATLHTAEQHIVVFCAGNSGPDPVTLWAPAEAKNVISVGATRNLRENIFAPEPIGSMEDMADYSSRGPTVDGRIAPTVVAPGDAVSTAYHTRGTANEVTGGMPILDSELYALFMGTSAAAPLVSGALAVITHWWRADHGGTDPSPAMAKALLVNGAVDIASTPPIPNEHEGWGRIHLGNVIRPSAPLVHMDQKHRFDDTGEVWSINVRVEDPQQPLKVTLAWSDAPGALEADPVLVNDLDLEVTTGDTHIVGNWFNNGWSDAGGEPDRRNNLENVYVLEPGSTAMITVTVASLAGDGVPYAGDATDQDFALVCFNCVRLAPEPRRPTGRVRSAGS